MASAALPLPQPARSMQLGERGSCRAVWALTESARQEPRRLALPSHWPGSACFALMPPDRQQYLHEDQQHDEDFQELQAQSAGLVGKDLVDALGHFELALD